MCFVLSAFTSKSPYYRPKIVVISQIAALYLRNACRYVWFDTADDIYPGSAPSNLDSIIDCCHSLRCDVVNFHSFKAKFGVISGMLLLASLLKSVLKYHLNNRF